MCVTASYLLQPCRSLLPLHAKDSRVRPLYLSVPAMNHCASSWLTTSFGAISFNFISLITENMASLVCLFLGHTGGQSTHPLPINPFSGTDQDNNDNNSWQINNTLTPPPMIKLIIARAAQSDVITYNWVSPATSGYCWDYATLEQ